MQKQLFKLKTLCRMAITLKTLSICSSCLRGLCSFPCILLHTTKASIDIWLLEFSNFSIRNLHISDLMYRSPCWHSREFPDILSMWALASTKSIPAKTPPCLHSRFAGVVEKPSNRWKLLIMIYMISWIKKYIIVIKMKLKKILIRYYPPGIIL
jgi:hypothetical protein